MSTTTPQACAAPTTDPFRNLATVSLIELNERAALQTRTDRKYLLTQADLAELFLGVDDGVRVLEVEGRQRFGYESTYFDTPGLDSYLDAARSRPNRFKVRTRSYLETGDSYLEVKTRDRGRQTRKTRQGTPAESHDELAPAAARFVTESINAALPRRSLSNVETTVASLRPTLRNHYQRTTLLVSPTTPHLGITGQPSRATIDTSLVLTAPGHHSRFQPDLVIIETKTAGPPSPIDRLLWRAGHRPTKVSKYGTGMALMYPGLPAAKWNRVLRRHFAWIPDHAASDWPDIPS